MVSTANRDHDDPRIDAAAIDAKWQARWEADRLYTTPNESDLPKWYSLTMYPYPSGMLHIGHWYAFVAPGYLRPPAAHARLQRALPDGLRCLRPARRERCDPQQHPPGHLDLREHRRDARAVRPDGRHDRLAREVITCTPEYYRWNQWLFLQMLEERAGLPRQGRRLVVPERPDRARQRAGAGRQHLRALRLRGLQARPGAVVLPDHRLRRRTAARLQKTWIGPSASRRCSATGSAAPKAPACASRWRPATNWRSSPPARTPSGARPSWCWRRSTRWWQRSPRLSSARRSRPTSSRRARRPRSSACRPIESASAHRGLHRRLRHQSGHR